MKCMENTWFPYNLLNFRSDHPLFLNAFVKRKSVDKACTNLANQLQISLVPDNLLAIYRRVICKYLPLASLTLHLPHQKQTPAYSTTNNALTLNLNIEGTSIGNIEYYFLQQLTLAQKKLLNKLNSQLAYPLHNAFNYQQMKKLAFQDNLTGLANRNQFEESFIKSVEYSRNHNVSFSLLILDLDGFKRVNDKYGHQTGDLVLSTFARLLVECCRGRDEVFRIGGDEFTILLNDANKKYVPQIANRIQQAVAKEALLSQFSISSSIGSAHYLGNDNLNSLFERADLALYRAKNNGKNCFEISFCGQPD